MTISRTRIAQLTMLMVVAHTFVLHADEARDVSRTLGRDLVFHASFDESPNADFAAGDGQIYTAASLDRKIVDSGLKAPGASIRPNGKWGKSLRFTQNTKEVVFYKANQNIDFQKESFQGTVSMWLSLTPDVDLKPGYVDPIQITDKKWNDASFFVDFTKDDNPRHVRLGVFADYGFWNPTDRKWEDIADDERPMVVVTKPPFDRNRWTHVAWTFKNFNLRNDDRKPEACFYLDGKIQGTIDDPQQFTWQPENAVIMLGIGYIGGIDDIAIFKRALSASEIDSLGRLANGATDLHK